MDTKFITNQEKLLGDVVNNIIPSSNKLYFLIGYFYFSGFKEIYENIKDKEIKILVGLEIETELSNKIREFELITNVSTSRGRIRDTYYKSLVTLFNETDYFDSEEKQEAFKIFLSKIQDGTLEIKRTSHPNHAKLYIFENKPEFSQGGEFPGSVITGSSNLSHAGLRGRFEINVISREVANYREAYKIFDNLWRDAVLIVNKENIGDFLHNVVGKVWINKVPKPFLLYVRVLEEYFQLHSREFVRLPAEITRGKYINLKYQIDAVKRTLNILNRHNGVIVADVVGLGKSIITSAIAHNLNMKTLVIAPPHLRRQWEDYRFDFEFNAKVYSSGKIEDALKENDDEEEKLIIIDEAHKYRNELTADYANLHQLCQRNKIVLLTATPFNNRPQDIFSMVKLFQLPTRSTIQTVENLSYQFKRLITEYQDIKKFQGSQKGSGKAVSSRVKKVANEIRDMLYPLVIRRSRLDLDAIKEYKDDLKAQNIEFPKVHDPQIIEYSLDDLSDLYEKTLEIIAPEDIDEGFIGARYKPTSYIKNFEKYKDRIAKEMGVDENLLRQTQINLAQFMKRLLVRRFESSIFAFKETMESLIHHSEVICKWYEDIGKVPIFKKGKLPDVDSLLEATGDDLDEELKEARLDEELEQYKEKGLWCIESKEIRKQFIDDVKKDIKILKEVHNKWFGEGFPHDPKIAHFKEHIDSKLKENPDRKIVVFTEFSDTADYIADKLKNDFRLFKYSAKDASEKNKELIRENFDASSKHQKNDYDVLIATDAISEGFNLHRAGIVFNYDIPYNPTRVIQRVGRINRVNKKVFDELFIFNFFPTATGEKETRIRQVSTLKIAMIHALFGEDTKVLTDEEELESYFAKQFRDSLDAQEELSPEAKHEDFIRNLRISNPEVVDEAMKLPKRCRIKRTVKKKEKGIIVFGKKGEEFAFKFGSKDTEPRPLTLMEALRLFEAEITESSEKPSSFFNSIYDKICRKLFTQKSEVALDRGKRDTILKVEALKKKQPKDNDYLEDLYYVLKDLDALPSRYAKLIRSIKIENLNDDYKDLKKQIPHNYLLNIIDRERQIEEGKESLILSEELI